MTEDSRHLLPRYRVANEQQARMRMRAIDRRARKKKRGRGRFKLKEEGRCRLCLRLRKVRPLTRHHLVPLSLGGSWEDDNIVPLCRLCHDAVDANGYGNRLDQLQWRSMLRRVLYHEEISHVRAKLGEEWLEWSYPTMRELADRKLARAVVGMPRGFVTTTQYRRELAEIGKRVASARAS